MTKYLCSYCGGWEDEKTNINKCSYVFLKHSEDVRHICKECYIQVFESPLLIDVFDKILGKPKVL